MKRFLSLSFFLFAFTCLNAQQNSVLSSGNWYKISVSLDGVYKLDNNDLQSLGIKTSNLSVNSIKLFGNGGGMLPALNSDFRNNDLQENAIQVVDLNGNGIFNNDDYHTPIDIAGKTQVFVSRLRKDLKKGNAFNFWVVSDNLIKGAALNSVQIAENIVNRKVIKHEKN